MNCVDMLQNGAGDSTRAAHVDGPRADLFRCCFALGWPPFAGVLTICWLMVAKPDF